VRRFIRSLLKREPPPPQPPEEHNERAEFEGTYPKKYDHVVRIVVSVPAAEAPDLRVLLNSRSWPFRESENPPESTRSRYVRFTVHVPILGASLWAETEAASRFSRACTQARIEAHLVSTSRPRSSGATFRTYRVVPDVAAPHGVLRSRLHELVLHACSQGTIRARSLARAKEELPGFLEENPGVGRDVDVTVRGPEGPVAEPARGPLPSVRDVLVLSLAGIVVCTVVALVFTVVLPGGSVQLAGTVILATACFVGVCLLLRQLREGTVNTWLPVVITGLFPVLLIPAAHLNVYAYLSEFGISPGDAEISGYHLFLSGREAAVIIFLTAVFALSLFGFLFHFHFGGFGSKGVVIWSLAVGSVALYTFLPVRFILDSSTSTGAEHVAHYQDGGAPVSQFGIVPTPVCVEQSSEIDDRFGPAPPTDRPVLHFGFANDIDFLWDPEEELTKVPSFSVPLTPVTGLDSTCPDPPNNEDSG